MLTVQQAFQAMRYFLEQYNEREPRHRKESIDQLLGWMTQDSWTDPQITADPAQWHDWLASVERALREPGTGT
jgi:hypothetical protein